jgi:hypothetical protein
MSFFDEIEKDANNISKEYLGPDYNYHDKIKNPSELGMSGKGDMKALSRDIAGIVDYIEILVSGTGPASKTGTPLGNKYFLKTAAQCKNYKDKSLQTRSMYINNVPTKSIPIISNLSGMQFPDFRGLVPGVLEDIYSINPVKMFSAFTEGDEPMCAQVELDTVDSNNITRKNKAYVPITELLDLENDGKIPKGTVTTEMRQIYDGIKKSSNTKETFTNLWNRISDDDSFKYKGKYKDDKYLNYVYLFILSGLLFYISFKLMKK